MKRGRERLAPLAVGLFLTACAAGPAPSANVPIPTQGPPGYIEFYCASCVTGWAVHEIRNGREKRVLNQGFARRSLDLLHNPVRMRRAGIAYPPGEVEFVIRLLPSSPPTQFISERIHLSVIEGVIIPVRIDAHKQTHITMEWKTVVGPPLPVSNDAASVERLSTALSDPDWGVRWYAAEAIGRINGNVGEELRAPLQTLASDEAYERCLEKETTIQCSLVSEQAQQVLRMVGGKKDSLPSDHESPVPNDARDRRQDF